MPKSKATPARVTRKSDDELTAETLAEWRRRVEREGATHSSSHERWDAIASSFIASLPDEVRRARDLERVVGAFRRAVEREAVLGIPVDEIERARIEQARAKLLPKVEVDVPLVALRVSDRSKLRLRRKIRRQAVDAAVPLSADTIRRWYLALIRYLDACAAAGIFRPPRDEEIEPESAVARARAALPFSLASMPERELAAVYAAWPPDRKLAKYERLSALLKAAWAANVPAKTLKNAATGAR